MYETIKRLYAKTKNTAVVEKALVKGCITEEEKNAILAGRGGVNESN